MSVLFIAEGGEYRPAAGTKAKILRFADLPDGWHFGQGKAASWGTVGSALSVLGLGDVLGLPSDAFPGADGEIAVSFYGEGEVFEVVVGPHGVETAFSEPLDGGQGCDVEVPDISTYGEVYSRLLNLVAEPEWHSHDLSVHFISTSTYQELPTLHSSIQAEQLL